MLCHSPFCWHHLPILQTRHADQVQMGIPIQTTLTPLPLSQTISPAPNGNFPSDS